MKDYQNEEEFDYEEDDLDYEEEFDYEIEEEFDYEEEEFDYEEDDIEELTNEDEAENIKGNSQNQNNEDDIDFGENLTNEDEEFSSSEIIDSYNLNEDEEEIDFEEKFEISEDYQSNPELVKDAVTGNLEPALINEPKSISNEEDSQINNALKAYLVSDFVLQYISLKPNIFEDISNDLLFVFLKNLKNNCPEHINNENDIANDINAMPIIIENFKEEEDFKKMFSFLAWISSISKVIMVQDSYVDTREILFKNLEEAEAIKLKIEKLLSKKKNIFQLSKDIDTLKNKINQIKKSFKILHLKLPTKDSND